jgi:hypothetical protein
MYRNMNRVSGGFRIADIPFVGYLPEDVQDDGDSGFGGLYNEAQNPAYAGLRLRWRFFELPADGEFYAWGDGRISFTGAADGEYQAGYRFDLDGVYQGDAYSLLFVGPVVIDCTPGQALATGVAADVLEEGGAVEPVIINCTPATAVAAGVVAQIIQPVIINCVPGAAMARGVSAQIINSDGDLVASDKCTSVASARVRMVVSPARRRMLIAN